MSRMLKEMQSSKGLTLIELLVVVAVIGVLAAVTWVMVNPPEIAKRSRDAYRLIDLADFKQAINAAVAESTGSAVQALCVDSPYPCTGSSNKGSNSVSGKGWLKMNLAAQKSVNMPSLHVDPINDSNYHYTFCANGDQWEISAKLESDKENSRMSHDSGNDDKLYEVGTNLTLIAPSGGSCTY